MGWAGLVQVGKIIGHWLSELGKLQSWHVFSKQRLMIEDIDSSYTLC